MSDATEKAAELVNAQFNEIPEVYTGPYVRPKTVSEVDNLWQFVTVGVFVAVNLENYEKVPVIGKVVEKDEDNVKVHYWKGSWNKKWTPWLYNNLPWIDELPKDCIYLASFELDENDKLQKDTKQSIREFFNKDKTN
ncbi:uncharacterized protein LOC114532975 [Dendronephthya gigantea]|uniref:uncharacterized protein LOC114517664 n=1 Tax=Dendronephthya gigantea TaxID=151771 RepID=UPI00106D9F21|nr:uncharacterized protein LOC114517664 [Dendronephthya gigantea]XP_028410358.1 uncharacterized protein LOC114532975 [Dendronephthya gigantea]